MVPKSAVLSLVIVAAAGPVVSAPIPGLLPAGAVGDLVKSLGKGLLSGAAVTGLLSLVDPSSDSKTARDLDERSIATALEKLFGVRAEALKSVLKKAIIGGAASGVAATVVDGVAGQNNRRGLGPGVDTISGPALDALRDALFGHIDSSISGVAADGGEGPEERRTIS
ncbi:hypothetical protein C8R45DRAFT_246942 [Mycena sanguinolenta]|nr:hypothetical protein C8R45DRAFT_246942 [Mycena sanguinolenta]